MEQEILAAQERLLRKREELQVTGNHTPLMQSVDRCTHGILLSIGCCICNPKPSHPLNGDVCEHGSPKEFTCYECQEKEASEKFILQEKDKYRKTLSDIVPLLKKAGVPKKYLDSVFETFIGNTKAVDECHKYKTGGLVLYGATGCGKTHLAVSILKERLCNSITGIIDREWEREHFYSPESSQFITIPDLLLEIRASFQGSGKTEQEIIDYYSSIAFLVMDDLGSEKTTEFSVTTLYIIIDRRDRELLPTVITTNLSSQEIEERLDARIASRLAGWKNIKINMPDYRKKR